MTQKQSSGTTAVEAQERLTQKSDRLVAEAITFIDEAMEKWTPINQKDRVISISFFTATLMSGRPWNSTLSITLGRSERRKIASHYTRLGYSRIRWKSRKTNLSDGRQDVTLVVRLTIPKA